MVFILQKNIDELSAACKENMYFVFGRQSCPYCRGAVELLKSTGTAFQFHSTDSDLYRTEFASRVPANHRTVPQIFLNHQFIGGFDALKTHFF